MASRRLATIDIGTNSVLLLAAEARDDGSVVPLAERIEITRLGRGVDRTGLLSDAALDDTLGAVRSFADDARSLGCEGVFATATSAARDARNGHLLVERAAALGVPVEIIAGEREAQLSYVAVAGEFARNGESIAVIDIGGGSTEVILGAGASMRWRHSYDVGSVRLTERHLPSDPPTPDELTALEQALADELSSAPKPDGAPRVVGIAGTFTTLATIELGLDTWDATKVHGLELPLETLSRLCRQLSALPLADRRKLPGLPEKRADVIVAGAYIAEATVRALGADRVTIGDRGVRWGYLYERLAR